MKCLYLKSTQFDCNLRPADVELGVKSMLDSLRAVQQQCVLPPELALRGPLRKLPEEVPVALLCAVHLRNGRRVHLGQHHQHLPAALQLRLNDGRLPHELHVHVGQQLCWALLCNGCQPYPLCSDWDDAVSVRLV